MPLWGLPHRGTRAHACFAQCRFYQGELAGLDDGEAGPATVVRTGAEETGTQPASTSGAGAIQVERGVLDSRARTPSPVLGPSLDPLTARVGHLRSPLHRQASCSLCSPAPVCAGSKPA